MSAQILEIDERIGPGGVADPPRLAYFAYREGRHISLDTVRDDPNLRIYGLDDESRRAIFVSTPPDIDLTAEAFVGQTQYNTAQYLVVMTYEELFQLASEVQSPEPPIFVYTVGRSGSTLLTKAFNEVEGVIGFSEPGMMTNCLALREPDGSRDQEIIQLIRSCIHMFCKPLDKKATYVIKWQSWVIHLADLLQAAFPNALNIFLYRDATTWTDSWHRIFIKLGIDFDAPSDLSAWGDNDTIRRLVPLFTQLTDGFGKATTIDAGVTIWLSPMDEYLKLYQQNKKIPFVAVRFEDLVTYREQVLRSLFDYCGLPTTELDGVLKVFERDAQEGTPLEGTSQQTGEKQLALTDEHIMRVHSILQKHDVIKTPDFFLPGTIEFDQQ